MEGKVHACGGRCDEEHKMKRRCGESKKASVNSEENECINYAVRFPDAAPGLMYRYINQCLKKAEEDSVPCGDSSKGDQQLHHLVTYRTRST